MPLPVISFAAAIWASIAAFVMTLAVPLVVHLLKAFGIGIVVYTGATFAMDAADTFITTNYNALPVVLYSMLTLAGVDSGIKILFAAYAANIAIKATTGSFKKFSFTS